MSELRYYNDKISKLEIRRDILKETLADNKNKLEYWQARKTGAIEARKVFQELSKQAQKQLEYSISNIVTRALRAIPFKEKYDFLLEFKPGRGKIEADLWFVKDGERIKPTEIGAVGGGACDIAALALRLANWSLKPCRPILILDEPFKHLSPDLHIAAGEMLKELTSKLKIQVIMVSHSETINLVADNVIQL